MKYPLLVFLLAAASAWGVYSDSHAERLSVSMAREASQPGASFVKDMNARIGTIQEEVTRLSPDVIGNHNEDPKEVRQAISEVQNDARHAQQELKLLTHATNSEVARERFNSAMQQLEVSYAKARELAGKEGGVLAE